MVENSPVCILFLHSSVSGHVGDVRILATVYDAAVKINISLCVSLFNYFRYTGPPPHFVLNFALRLLTFTKDLP